VSLAPVGVIKATAGGGSAALEEESQLREVIGEIVVGAIRGTSFSWNMGVYGNCPRLVRNIQPVGHRLPLHYDSMVREALLLEWYSSLSLPFCIRHSLSACELLYHQLKLSNQASVRTNLSSVFTLSWCVSSLSDEVTSF
jgi:hypothetical protein